MGTVKHERVGGEILFFKKNKKHTNTVIYREETFQVDDVVGLVEACRSLNALFLLQSL